MAQFVYTMQQVGKVVPPKREILKDISLSFFPGAKIGVLGLNGAGKSTLLRIMAGVDTEFNGEARPKADIKIGYLPQEPDLDDEKDVRGNVQEGIKDIINLVEEFNDISDKFAEPMGDDEMTALLEKQGELQNQIDEVKEGMVQNIEKVLERGEKIELLVDKTDRLNQQAFRFEASSRGLRKHLYWRRMRNIAICSAFGLLIVFILVAEGCGGFDFHRCRRH